MREIRSPLDGILSPFAARAGVDAYAVQGLSPLLVADFTSPYYRKAGSTSTFDSTFTHSRAGNATMVDSDGLIKWAPHNLALNSAAPATQSITVVSGADYTVEITGSGSVALTGAGTGTVTAGNPVEITASTTTLTLTVTGTPSTMWAYRSDLGGMVNNPDTGTSYVPTTSAAVYQARRNHYTYNGTSWVNSGLLLETEARTNLIQYSEDFTTSWIPNRLTPVADETGPDGLSNSAHTLTDTNTGGTNSSSIRLSSTVATNLAYTFSIFAKADALSWIKLAAQFFTTPADGGAWFNLSTGAKGTEETGFTATINDAGDGWHRCSITFTTDASDTSGFLYVYICGSDNSIIVDQDGTSSILIYGAQLEAGATPSSYMPTAGVTFTRPTESLQIAAADMPWPTPDVIGAELVTNGEFETGTTGWTGVSSNLSIVSERLRVTSTSGSSYARLDGFAVEVGKVYYVSADVSNIGGTKAQLWVGSGYGLANWLLIDNLTTDSTVTGVFTATTTTAYLELVGNTSAGQSTDWDNVSVREIDPLSVSLQMQGKITYVDDGDNATATMIRWQTGGQYVQMRLRTDSTRTGAAYAIMNNGIATLGQDTNGAVADLSPGVLVPLNTASRFGSTFLNVAMDGVSATALTTPTALPDLSATDFSLGYDYMGTIGLFRAWNVDIGDAGIEDATS